MQRMQRMQKVTDWIKRRHFSWLLINRYVRSLVLVGFGLFAGWLFFHSSGNEKPDRNNHAVVSPGEEIWTCSMHPQIRMDHPGKCPICGMDLIPLSQGGVTRDPLAIRLSAEAIALANVQTSVVSNKMSTREVRLYGTVQPDERSLQNHSGPYPGPD